jgi:hypothetical protein
MGTFAEAIDYRGMGYILVLPFPFATYCGYFYRFLFAQTNEILSTSVTSLYPLKLCTVCRSLHTCIFVNVHMYTCICICIHQYTVYTCVYIAQTQINDICKRKHIHESPESSRDGSPGNFSHTVFRLLLV